MSIKPFVYIKKENPENYWGTWTPLITPLPPPPLAATALLSYLNESNTLKPIRFNSIHLAPS